MTSSPGTVRDPHSQFCNRPARHGLGWYDKGPDDYNPDQADADEDGVGDVCECEGEGLAEQGGPGVRAVSFSGAGEVGLRKVGNDEWTNDIYDSDGTKGIGDPVWTDPDCTGTPVKNEPICFKKGSQPRIKVKLCNCEAREIVVRAVNAAWGIEWRKSVSAQQSQGTIDLETPVGALPDSVQTGVLSLSWSLSEDGGATWTAIGETAHTIFIPFAAVSGSRAAKRMQWVCNAGAGAANDVDCARKMHVALVPLFDLNAGSEEPGAHPWRALDGQKGDCQVLSYLLKSAIQHHGLTGAVNVTYVYASHDTNCTSPSDVANETTPCPTHGWEKLVLWLPAPNRYVACCVYKNQVWFPGGWDWDKPTGLEILQQCAGPPCAMEKQWWTWFDPLAHQCAPVPCPPPPCP